MHSSINLFFVFSLLILFFNPKDMQPLLVSSSSEGKLFELHSIPHGYLTFLGDSHHLQSDAIALTKADMSPDAPRSTGMVLYNHPILFLDPYLGKVLSFSTMFSFSIETIYENENIYGDAQAPADGLAFLITPAKDFVGSLGYLGLVDSTNLTRNKFIAIEYDTRCDPMFQDPNDNHLGLDINSLHSVQLVTSSVNMKSGNVITTWIDYKSEEKRLEVFLSSSNLKPEKPLLKVDIDLFDYLKENMFVGFSAATEGSIQLTRIERWEFTIVEFSPPPPLSPSHPETGTTFPNPSKTGHRHRNLSELAIGLVVGVCFVSFALVFYWFCWKKLMGMVQKLEVTDYLKMQTTRSSGGTSSQEIRLSIPDTNPHEVARGVIIEKVFDDETEFIRVKTGKPIIPLLKLFAYDITLV